jgi:hypothetical protein
MVYLVLQSNKFNLQRIVAHYFGMTYELLLHLKIIININNIITIIITTDNNKNICSESSVLLSSFLSLRCGESKCCEGRLRPGMEGSC